MSLSTRRQENSDRAEWLTIKKEQQTLQSIKNLKQNQITPIDIKFEHLQTNKKQKLKNNSLSNKKDKFDFENFNKI